jgi:acetylornithine deacetylase/succinyl-diaminopimelate desuccinylase-like protein
MIAIGHRGLYRFRLTTYSEATHILPGTSPEEIKRLIKEQLERFSIPNSQLEDLLVVPAAETHPQAAVVQTLAAAVAAITGTHPRVEGSGPACDRWMFITRGIPTVCEYGATYGGVHGADEWVDLESLRSTTEIYAHTILHYLENKSSCG